MVTISYISDHPKYDDTIMVSRQILRLGNAIKRDISKIVSFYSKESTSKTNELIWNCKKRIFERLEKVAKIREQKKIQESWWNDILKRALSQVYKHTNSIEFRNKFDSLIKIDITDTWQTGIIFLKEYMRIVVRIPEDKINLLFHK